jgi:hypothetical protein
MVLLVVVVKEVVLVVEAHVVVVHVLGQVLIISEVRLGQGLVAELVVLATH